MEFINQKWIKLEKKKLSNPAYEMPNGFQDIPEKFIINRPKQLENFNKFRETIREIGYDINIIYAKSNDSDQFVGLTTDNKICYLRYFPSDMGAQNLVYVKGVKIKLTDWFTKSLEERMQYLN